MANVYLHVMCNSLRAILVQSLEAYEIFRILELQDGREREKERTWSLQVPLIYHSVIIVLAIIRKSLRNFLARSPRRSSFPKHYHQAMILFFALLIKIIKCQS